MTTQSLADLQATRTQTATIYGLTLCEQFEDGSIAFAGERGGKFYFLGFIGRRRRAAAYYHFRTVEARDNYRTTWLSERRTAITAKHERKVANRQPHSLKVGDVLYTSWGYEQTNIEFYEVTAVRGAVVDMQELQQDRTEHPQGMSGRCTPRKGAYRSDTIKGKRPNARNAVRMTSFSYASPWDGHPLGWSSYA